VSYWFFCSYARSDRPDDAEKSDPSNKDYLRNFYDDLRREVSLILPKSWLDKQQGISLPLEESRTDRQIAFFDTESIQSGTVWEPEIEKALRTSRVMICLCSSAYVDSMYCGREFQVFWERREEYIRIHQPQKDLRVILPILWGPPPRDLPRVIASLQYNSEGYPPVYAREGLLQMMRINSYNDDYWLFVRQLARDIVDAGEQHPLPDLPKLRPMQKVDSAFHPAAGQDTRFNSQPASPNRTHFVFVAARSTELAGIKTEVERYTEQGGWYWRPYLPATEDSVGNLAQEVASRLKLRYHDLPLQDLLDQLRRIEKNKEVVIILLDAWTMRIESYKNLMCDYDESNFLNCAVMVPWNTPDSDTTQHRPELENTLNKTLERTIRKSKKSIYYQDSISSARDLRTKLSRTVAKIRMSLINEEAPKKKAEDAQIVQEALAKGIVLASQPPTLTGPAGRSS
jgi:FxsC-like protein